MRDAGVSIHFNSSIKNLSVPESDDQMITVTLENDESFEVDMFLFAAGRSGQTKDLQCDKAGIEMGKREAINVDSTYKTNIDHIYAVGDVIGFPALASTSADQGRVAVAHIFKTMDLEHLPQYFPYGIYTVPEVSMVGISEDEAREKKLNYCVGRSRYADMARGKIMGAKAGFMKLVFEHDSLEILGVHVIGHIATEIIHFGLYLVEEKKTLHDVIATVFNFPTLHDLYKYAAYDGLSTIAGHRVKP
jgi:NAD(P) transhydrogenase